jgi:NAD(P)-dependent dehydrogenase (short-subunit alcohol dehydrogenase family)
VIQNRDAPIVQTESQRAITKKVFLTGASAGIGLAAANLLTARGHQVWGTSRDPARLPPSIHPVRLDLGDPASFAEIFRGAWREAGHFDVLINNAGSGQFGPSDTLSAELLREQFQTLFFAHVELCQLALRAMRERGSGFIINVSSLAARLPVPFMGAYNAAKAAMASFTMTLQLELKSSGIRVIDLQPADIRTGFNDAVARSVAADPEEQARIDHAWRVVDKNMQAAPPPELVARQIARLIEASDPPSQITVGDFFQASVAPLIFRLLPQGVRLWGLKKYYRL